jgi:DNA-binding LacI/PurR family transcriptional regulator
VDQKATIKDVAKLAGVSLSTVSRVLNDTRNVNPILKETVLDAIKTLNYNPNQAARSLVRKTTGCIGIVVSNLHDPFFSDLVKGFELGGELSGMNIVFCSALKNAHDGTGRDRYVKFLTNGIADGVILYGSYLTDSSIVEYLTSLDSLKYMVIENEIPGIDCNKILIDNIGGTETAIDYLYQKGHRNIGCIIGDPNRRSILDRYNGFMNGIHKNNLKIKKDCIQYAYDDDDCRQRTLELISSENRPTAIFCSDDHYASLAIETIFAQGLNVPEDISVIGFDNRSVPNPHYSGPRITSIEQPLLEIGKDSVLMLASQLNADGKVSPINKIYQTKLVEKQTVKNLDKDRT